MRYLHCLTLILFLAQGAAAAQGPPPPPCGNAPPITPAGVSISYQGNISGCSQNGGVCIPGESISFTAATVFDYASAGCILGYAWDFGDGSAPVSTGFATSAHAFAEGGTFNVQLLTVTAGGSHATVMQPVSVANTVPTLHWYVVLVLLGILTAIGTARLR